MKRKSETMTATAATRKQYSETTIRWAEQMLLRGVAPSEVARETGINKDYVRTIKFRMGGQVLESEQVLSDTVSVVETPAPIVAENAETRRFKITTLDVVFYATTLTACAGLVTLLHWWGLPVSLVYSLILVDAMNKAKDVGLEKAARAGAVAVILFEMGSACVHTYLFNKVLWANYKALPWEIQQNVINGEIGWQNGDKPIIVAAVIAVVLSGSAVYAIENSIITARERAKTAPKY